MKTFSDEALAALERGDAIVSAAVAITSLGSTGVLATESGDGIAADGDILLEESGGPSPGIFLWGGYGQFTLDGDSGPETYSGIGDRSLATVSGGQIGGAAQSITLTLSGIDPEALAVLDASEVKGAPIVVRRLIFDSTGQNLLGAYVFARGRIDMVGVRETIGGSAAIDVVVETAARGLGRRGGRMRSDADQRLVNPTDGFYKNVSFAGEKTLYWGGKKPATAGAALGGSGPAGSLGSIGDHVGGSRA